MNKRSLVAALAIVVATAGSALAGGWPEPGRPVEAMIVTEQYERTQMYVRFEEPAPRRDEACIDYKHAMWIHGHPVITDREACRWPDGTLRNGPRPY